MNPKLIAINGPKKGTTFLLETEETSIGRESGNLIALNHSSISRRHCIIRREDQDFTIHDLGSFNGTFVNETPVSEQRLSPGDRVRIGNIQLLFVTEEIENDALTSGESVHLSDADYLTESSREVMAGSLLQQTEQHMMQSARH
jgi:pSer/pThr/pTyr-binding forkhead associated (FHA) protein